MEQFDITVIGSGPAGYVCAIRASQLGYKVCCIEKGQTLGGTCLNIGCIPSKSLLHSSHLFHQASELNQLGINFDNVSFDLNKIMKSKNESVESLTNGIDFLFKKNEGILTEPQVLRQAVIGILEFSAIEYFSRFSG